MAYYISFLKTLSLKLNTHSIHFFFNEVFIYIFILNFVYIYYIICIFKKASEFPLYVEAIKFFDHPECKKFMFNNFQKQNNNAYKINFSYGSHSSSNFNIKCI